MVTRCRSRVRIAGTIVAATGASIPATTPTRCRTSIAASSAMLRPPIRQASAAWLSLAPAHSGQGRAEANAAIASRPALPSTSRLT